MWVGSIYWAFNLHQAPSHDVLWLVPFYWWTGICILMNRYLASSSQPYETWELSVQFSSVTPSCPYLCDPMICSTPGLPAHYQLPELTQTHVHRPSDAIQPSHSHSLSSPSPPTFSLSQHQGLFQWVGSPHQVAKILEFQLRHHFFQWIFRTHFY